MAVSEKERRPVLPDGYELKPESAGYRWGSQSEELEKKLGFAPQPMVRWFNPRQLIGTGTQVFLSGIFGAYADKRDTLAALHRDVDCYDYRDEADELWLDYAADLGDGWNSTYSIARLLAAEALTVEGCDAPLPRGRILIFGGDEVYPTATRDEYKNRLVGPYRAALPEVESDEEAPHLYAVPGNHDWYDGLTSFTRLFGQKRWIGGWQTRQERSYFALALPHGWWLWGIDVQLESDIDLPQRDYFHKVAAEKMAAGDRVILCTAEPSWVYDQEGDPRANRNLAYIDEKIVQAHGGRVATTIAGDLHHYCRYQEEGGGRHKITSGGGGAFLHDTHSLPEALDHHSENDPASYVRKAVYPTPTTTRGLLWGNWKFPFTNPILSGLLAAIYVLYTWLLQTTTFSFNDDTFHGTFIEQLAGLSLSEDGMGEVLKRYWMVLMHSPENVVFLLLVLFGLALFVEAPKRHSKLARWGLGLGHGLLHLLLNLGLIWLFAWLNLSVCKMEADSVPQVLLFALEMLLVGGILGGMLMGLHLIVANLLFGFQRTPSMSAVRVGDFKNFLRLHVSRDRLTIYPLAIDRVPRNWRFNAGGAAGSPWFEPSDRELKARLIEEPITIPGAMEAKQ